MATSWENAVVPPHRGQTRIVLLRSAMTMSPDKGGVFDTLLGLVRLGLGGRAGNGKQYVSWIHEVDFVRAIDWIMARDHLNGPINLAAPNPIPNAEFMRDLRQASGVWFGLPATNWMLEAGAFLMRTETELILKSRRVTPGVLLNDGFAFEFPTWSTAAEDLCQKWKTAHRS